MATITQSRANLATNPSSEKTSGTVNVRTNLAVNPSAEVDLTHWVLAGGASGTLTRDTTRSLFGSACVKYAYVSGTATGVQYDTFAVSPNTTYTISFYVYVESGASPTFTICDAVYGNQNTMPNAGAAGAGWVRVYKTVTTVAAQTTMLIYNTMSVASTYYIDGLLIEQASLLQPYFDGSTKSLNLCPNPSLATDASGWSAQNAGGTSLSGSLMTSGGYTGPNFYRATVTVSPPDMNNPAWINVPVGQLTSGATYTLSAYIRSSAGRSMAFDLVSGSETYGAYFATNANGWTRISATWTTSNVSAVQVRIRPAASGAVLAVGETIDVDCVLIEDGSVLNPFYDGSALAPGDFTYVWSGTANASTSYQQAPGVAGYTSYITPVYSSTVWASSGTRSIRITPNTTGSDTSVSVGGDAGAIQLGMQPGGTYTVSATLRLAAPQAGTLLTSRARSISVFVNPPSGGYVESHSSVAPNVAGVTRLSVTFTIPLGSTEAFIRLYNGAAAGGGDVWWDDVLVEAANGVGTYFDGSSATWSDTGFAPAATRSYSWTGAANASTSVETLSTPLQNYQVTAPDGTIMGAGTVVGLLEVAGLRGAAPTRSSDTDRAGADGMAPGMSFITGRTVAVKWLLVNPAGVETALQILNRNWQVTNDPSTIVMTARDYLLQLAGGGSRPVSALQFQLPGRPVPLLVFGKPGKLDPPINSSYQFGWLEVQSEWIVPDGKIYDVTVNTFTGTLPSSAGGGAKFPWTFPVNFGPSTGGSLQVANAGLYPAKPVFRVTGPVTNPKITNTATGQFIRVNLALAAGDVLVIDTDSHVVRLNGANRNIALDVGSAFFTIPPGGASLSFASTDGGSVAGSVTAYTLNTYSAA